MPNIAHPAVIIGLGGTGKWILTYIKKSLLDTYGGVIPPTVQLLSFDTTSERPAKDGEAQEEDVKVGDVQLNSNAEFVYLGGNIKQICLDISNKGDYPYIGSWLQARAYLQSNDDRAFDISGGAGQKRPFGRMSLFLDLQQNTQAKVSNKIVTAISNVIAANKQLETVEIYVIASLAGGTGAGTFLDVAHLARWYANKHLVTGKFAIRGFLALQNTFNSVIQVGKIQPQAFAAMRELDRFMYVFNQSYPIVYNPNNPDLDTRYGGQGSDGRDSGKLFDSCFLLDASREKVSLDGVKPKHGVYPTIADAITMLLDGSVGDAFVQHYVNVGNDIALTQSRLGKPIYSSLGAFALVLPVEDIISSLSYRFARELLAEHLLNLEEVPSQGGQTRYVLRYEGNAREEAASFLRMTQSAKGVASTAFIQRIPDTIDRRNPQNDAYIKEVAFLSAAELLAWIIPPESDRTVEELAKQVRSDLQMVLATRVSPSNIEHDDPIEGCDRILSAVRTFKEEYLGLEIGGRKVGGRYQTALESCLKVHRDRYRRLLCEYLLNLLNGSAPENPDFQHEKRGKLGRAQAVLSHLVVSYHNEVAAFIGRVKATRAESGDLAHAQDEASLARTEMELKAAGGSGFMGIGKVVKDMHPAIKAQKIYLEAEQALIDTEINDLFFDFIQQTMRALQTETESFKAAIDGWVDALAQGITGEVTDPGLYRYLGDLNTRHQNERNDKQTNFKLVREYVTDQAYEQAVYEAQTASKFAEALASMVWTVEEQGGKIQVGLSNYVTASSDQRSGRTTTQRNTDQVLSVARRYFEPLRDTLTISDRLVKRYDPAQLARHLRDSCAAMIRFVSSEKAGGDAIETYFVCVNQGKHQTYFNEFGAALGSFGSAAYQNQVLQSVNPYTCTVLATTDRFTSEGLFAYVSAEREYNQYSGDARQLHIFPAEVNAVHLEQKLRTISESRRRFSLRLTAMLENIELVRRFVRAYLYRAIRPDAVDNRISRWNLHINTLRRRTSNVIALSRADNSLDLLDAMETFVFKRADYDNPTITIDMDQLDRDLDEREQQASGGDSSRLINMFEYLIEEDIEPLRQDKNQNMRDLGSVMRLLIDEQIESLKERLKHRGQAFDPSAKPLINVREIAGDARTAPSEEPKSSPEKQPVEVSGPTVPVETVTPPTPPTLPTDTRLERLREFYEMVQEGDLTADGFVKRVGKMLEGGDLGGLQEFYEMVQEGDMTADGFVRRAARILK
ncbi:MAG: tubulin-like doman-containing protein [Chloroflexales bacterium]